MGAISRSIVDFLHRDERYPKLDAFVYENGGYRWRVPKTTCSMFIVIFEHEYP